jgi:hypothetical protein
MREEKIMKKTVYMLSIPTYTGLFVIGTYRTHFMAKLAIAFSPFRRSSITLTKSPV